MKKSTKKVLENFPQLEQFLNSNESSLLYGQSLNKLTEVEQTFLRLAWFFENPKEESFSLENIYKNLDGQWVVFVLEVIYVFFAEDTFLVKKENFSVITEESEYLNQTDFARFLTDNGFEFSRQKLNIYVSRKVVPGCDVELSGVQYWKKETCQSYLDSLVREQDGEVKETVKELKYK